MNANTAVEDGCLMGFYILMMKAVSFYETSINIYQTIQCKVPEGSHVNDGHFNNVQL
jgi:hypothetical protein